MGQALYTAKERLASFMTSTRRGLVRDRCSDYIVIIAGVGAYIRKVPEGGPA
jgi:hypothetical protein